jgi:glutathione peroxidase-family protein
MGYEMKTKIVICGSTKNYSFISALADALRGEGFCVFDFPDASAVVRPEMDTLDLSVNQRG